MASRGDGSFDRGLLIGATLPQAAAWISGTIAGVAASAHLRHPDALGLDAVFPAFYLALLVGEVREAGRRDSHVAVAIAAAITLALMTFAPPGLAVVVASSAALVGLRRR